MQQEGVPVFHAEIDIVYPPNIFLRTEPQNDCPKPTINTNGELHQIRYVANEVSALESEPDSRHASEDAMGVRVATPITISSWLTALARQLRLSLSSNHELRNLARQLVSGAQSQHDKVFRIWSWVTNNIAVGNQPSRSATRSLADRSGSRLTVMMSMLQAVGLHAQLWLVKNRLITDKGTPKLPRVDAYDALVIGVRLRDEKRWMRVFPVSSAWPIEYVPAAYVNAPMHLVPFRGQTQLEGTSKTKTGEANLRSEVLPDHLETRDARIYEIDVRVDSSGGARVLGTLELRGQPAIAWRMFVEGSPEVPLAKVFEQLELVHWKSKDIVLKQVILHPEDKQRNSVNLRFELEIPQIARKDGAEVQMPLGMVFLNQVKSITQQKKRTRGLIVHPTESIVATIRYQLDGYRLAQIPQSQVLGDPQLAYFQRQVLSHYSSQDRSQLELRFNSELASQVLPATSYLRFRELGKEIDIADALKLRLIRTSQLSGE